MVIAATGVLHHPRYPDIEGLEDFAGACFHSARWDHDVALDGARVGVIGTGSTAVQITGALVDRVAHLSLFQRTAQWIAPLENPAYDEETRRLFREDPERLRAVHDEPERGLRGLLALRGRGRLAGDGGRRAGLPRQPREQRHRPRPAGAPAPRLPGRLQAPGPVGQLLRGDPAPERRAGHRGIERVEAGGVRTRDGRLHELDVLVLATGFHADAFMRPMDVVGRDGVTPGRGLGRPSHGLPLHLHPGVPQPLPAQRPERPGRATSRSSRWPSCSSATCCSSIDRLRSGECRRDQRHPGRHRRLRGRSAWRHPGTRSGPPGAPAGTSTTAACPRSGPSGSTASVRRWPPPTWRPTSRSERRGPAR